ncbi:MAG TPA: polyribonucleotide nucleotidyltransferase, partial [Firmicutes bacterium]|nr:polyribonucleotide nucleotidyltransferase [Bacillota bacterium]
RVFIASIDEDDAKRAVAMINELVHDPEQGEVYTGKVTRIMPFGAFVEVLPGKEGLVHISQLAYERVATVEDVVNIGDEVTV